MKCTVKDMELFMSKENTNWLFYVWGAVARLRWVWYHNLQILLGLGGIQLPLSEYWNNNNKTILYYDMDWV